MTMLHKFKFQKTILGNTAILNITVCVHDKNFTMSSFRIFFTKFKKE